MVTENAWRRLTAPLRRRIQLLITRAVARAVDPAALLQMLQVEAMSGELLDGVEHIEGYGRTAHPPAGSEALLASLGGNREHTVAIAAFHRQFRVRNLAAGEQVIYDDLGNIIYFKRDRILIDSGDLVEVVAPDVLVRASTKVRLETPLVEATQNMTIGGTLDVTGAVTMGSTVAVTGAATFSGATTINSTLSVSGGVSFSGTLSVTGDAAFGASISAVTDVTINGVSLKTHKHFVLATPGYSGNPT